MSIKSHDDTGGATPGVYRRFGVEDYLYPKQGLRSILLTFVFLYARLGGMVGTYTLTTDPRLRTALFAHYASSSAQYRTGERDSFRSH